MFPPKEMVGPESLPQVPLPQPTSMSSQAKHSREGARPVIDCWAHGALLSGETTRLCHQCMFPTLFQSSYRRGSPPSSWGGAILSSVCIRLLLCVHLNHSTLTTNWPGLPATTTTPLCRTGSTRTCGRDNPRVRSPPQCCRRIGHINRDLCKTHDPML